MASSLPIPAPPRTPTPPSPIPQEQGGYSWEHRDDGTSRTVRSEILLDPNALSLTFSNTGRFGSMGSPMSPPSCFSSPNLQPDGMMSLPPIRGAANPFNFQTQTIKDAPIVKSVCDSSMIISNPN